jgi:S1-C subfamily serine protease
MKRFFRKLISLLLILCVCCGSGRYQTNEYKVGSLIDNTYSYEIMYDNEWTKVGTAFAYKESLFKPAKIITARHVAEIQALGFPVRICEAQGAECHAVKSYVPHPYADVAELKISSTRRQGLVKAATVYIGQDVYLAGFPLGGELFVSKGIVSQLRSFAVDAQCLPGHSGSPVISSQGKVIGVVSSVRVEKFGLLENYCLLIPIDIVETI